MLSLCITLAILLNCCTSAQQLASDGLSPVDFLITSLPAFNGSFNDIPFKQYSGYMPLGDIDETALFFWFLESQSNPSTDPLVLWLNGGPGASSLDYGFWTEHGPFRLQQNAVSVLSNFNYSWNKIANVIYLETPSGVGYSYSNRSSGYNCSDNKTAEINYLFLQNFLNVFTDYGGSHEIVLTGESYGGHYIPQLAQYIIQHNNNKWNVTGFLLGNPDINLDFDYAPNAFAFTTYMWSHGLLPQTAYIKSFVACDWDQFLTNCSREFTHPTDECIAANNASYEYMPTCIPDMNPPTSCNHDIYVPTCHENSTSKVEFQQDGYVYNPCMYNWTPMYMNREDVLKAIHAFGHYNRTYPDAPSNWFYADNRQNMALLYPYFFEQRPNWKISIISGDADPDGNCLSMQREITCLNRPVVKEWFNWMMDGDVAGAVQIYQGITFQTVKHCGHMIPTYCPKAGFQFFQQYVSGIYSS